jgi:zinc transporter 9
MAASSSASVLAALAGNSFVTLIKVVGFLASGSGAMLSEAVHSGADTANQALLYLGLRRGTRGADDDHHYGYGSDRFIFGLLSASGIFFVGCGVTVYHGIHSMLHPRLPEIGLLTLGVLGLSLLIEGAVLAFAFRTLNSQRAGAPWGAFLRDGADPATTAIVLEDGVAVTGVLLAAAGMLAAKWTGVAQLDALASILIGLLLGGVAVYLVVQNRKLLMGGAVPDAAEAKFVEVLRGWPSVLEVRDVKTRQITPEAYQFKAEIVFRPEHFGALLEARHPKPRGGSEAFTALADAMVGALSRDIDRLEAKVREAIPFARHIDIEVDHAERRGAGEPSRR